MLCAAVLVYVLRRLFLHVACLFFDIVHNVLLAVNVERQIPVRPESLVCTSAV